MDNEHTLGHGTQSGGHDHDHPEREAHGPNCGCGEHKQKTADHAGHGPDCGCGHEHKAADHVHGAACGCGHDHKAADHVHGAACGCGHDHKAAGHVHGAACGCGHDHKAAGHEGHDHGPDCGCEWHEHDDVTDGPNYDNGLSIAENNVLMALLERGGLPVARFALTSSKEHEAYAVAMSPVYIADQGDSLETIRKYGALYVGMEDKGLIELDYEFPLPGYPYREYHDSWAWSHFVETAAEAKQRGFTFDTPHLELGGITLTEHGHEVVDDMIG